MSKRTPKSADELLAYWLDISKRPDLNVDDYVRFSDMVKLTRTYPIAGHSPSEQRFLDRLGFLAWKHDEFLKSAIQSGRLANHDYALMKDYAKKFIARIKKYCALDIVSAIQSRTPLQDAEAILTSSSKLSHRWAAGIIASNHIATVLIRLCAFEPNERYPDDIKTLYDRLKQRTDDKKLRTFLTKSFRRFEDADKTRNRCAHVNEGEPTKQEIEQSIALARLLQKYLPRSPSRA